MNNYKDLKLWQKSVDLAVEVYKVTNSFPKEEMYGLTSQIQKQIDEIQKMNWALKRSLNLTKD
ncbi:MAG: four helix bundle protein [Cyclobacteriaceae bacterium]|nr:four helix bundle protein [Cyclobacteriaceae bacterium]